MSRMTRLSHLSVITLAAALATPAWAEAADAEANDIVVTAQAANRTEVTRGGQLGAFGDKAAEDVPFSIKSYNSALILNQQPTTLGQVLENDPSIRTTYGFGTAAEQFVIRGFTLFSDDIALDGMYGITPRQLVAPELYESVQVLNGASAFLNGAAPGGTAIGGTVNLIPKRAGDRDLTRVTGSYISDSHVGGSFDIARRFGGNGEFGVRLNGAARTGDVAIDDEFRSTYVAGIGLDYRGADVRLSLDVAYQRYKVRHLRSKVSLGGLTSIPRVPRASANYNQPWTYSKLRDVFGTAKAEWDVAENATLYASFGARDGAERSLTDGITVTDAATGAATGSALFVPANTNNEAAQAGLRVKLAQGGVSHEINFGGSANWQEFRTAFEFPAGFATNLYDTPTVPRPGPGFVGGNLSDPLVSNRTRLMSAFASDTIGLFDDRLLISGGLRLQQLRIRSYNAYGDGALASVYETNAVTPVVGIVVKPVAGVSLFANRVEGLTQGGIAPATAINTAGQTVFVTNAGQSLSATKSTQYEVGGKLTLGRFNASLAAFQIKQPRAAQTVPDTITPNAYVFTRIGQQRHRGIELSVDGELAEGLRVIAGGSITDAKLRRTGVATLDGNRVPGVPKYLANGNVEYDLPFVPGLTVTGRVVYTSKQKVNAANTLELNDWIRFDLGARFVAAIAERPVTFRVGVDNVANRRFWTLADDNFSPLILQGAPRTYRASASIDF